MQRVRVKLVIIVDILFLFVEHNSGQYEIDDCNVNESSCLRVSWIASI